MRASLRSGTPRGAACLPTGPAGAALPAGEPEEVTFTNLPECFLPLQALRERATTRSQRLGAPFWKDAIGPGTGASVTMQKCRNKSDSVIEVGGLRL